MIIHLKKNLDIFLYDPYFIRYRKLPKKYELLICTDVMEHIQKHEIEDSLIKMDNYSIKICIFLFVLDQQKTSTRWSKCSCHFNE